MTNDQRHVSCADLEQVLPAAWKGELSRADHAALDAHLAECAACRALARDLEDAWLSVSLEDVAVPSESLRTRVMQAAARSLPAAPLSHRSVVAGPTTAHAWWKGAAAAAACLVVGVLAGRAMPDREMQQEVASLRDELRSVQQVMTLSLIQQASATERLQAVATAAQIDEPDAQVRDALLDALAHDTNVNVRLAAIDALRGLSADQRVGAQLVASARAQDSPLVQVAVIDALVERRERSAEPALRAIASDEKAASVVRERARWALGKLQGSAL